MFNQIRHIKNSEEQSYGICDCFDVRYIVYFDCIGGNVSVNTYIVHPKRGGLIRRDCSPFYSAFLSWGGPFTIQYVRE